MLAGMGLAIVAVIIFLVGFAAFVAILEGSRRREAARKNQALLGVVAPRQYVDLTPAQQAEIRKMLDKDADK